MSPTLLSTLKTVHVVAAILFVGNVIVTGVWATVLFRARAVSGFRAAARAIIITDWIFTFAGGGVLVMSGVALSMGRGLSVWGTPWIRQALLALTLSTAVWLVVLVPAQRAMGRADAHTGITDDVALARAFHRWNVTGWLATIPLIYAVWCMVAKPGM
jgi:uncharacterized membrane protein